MDNGLNIRLDMTLKAVSSDVSLPRIHSASFLPHALSPSLSLFPALSPVNVVKEHRTKVYRKDQQRNFPGDQQLQVTGVL